MSKDRDWLRDEKWGFFSMVGQFLSVIIAVFAPKINLAGPIMAITGAVLLVALPLAAMAFLLLTARRPFWSGSRRPLWLLGVSFLLTLAGIVLSLAHFWPTIGIPGLGRLAALTPWGLVMGLAVTFLQFLRSRMLRRTFRYPEATAVTRMQGILSIWLLVGALAFGDQLQIWWLRLVGGTDSIALLGSIEDVTVQMNLDRLCQDVALWRAGRIRFTCRDISVGVQAHADMGAGLEAYRHNRSLAGLLWIGTPAEPEATHPHGIVIRRRPFLENADTDYSLVPGDEEPWPSISQAILEHTSLVKCDRRQSQEVVALARAWRDGNYAAAIAAQPFHPAYLRCLAESALDTQALFALNDLHPDILYAMGDAWADPDQKAVNRLEYGLTYARLLVHSGQLEEAQAVLDRIELDRRVDNISERQVQFAHRKALAELELSRCQSGSDPATRTSSCQLALEHFRTLGAAQPAWLVHYGLGRAQVLLSLYRVGAEAAELRRAAIAELGALRPGALVDLWRMLRGSQTPSCLQLNAQRWSGFAQALDGRPIDPEPAPLDGDRMSGCQCGIRVSIPLAVSSAAITATLGLPVPGLHYAVVPLDYSEAATAMTIPLADLGQGLYQADLVLPGAPDAPMRFVYYDRVSKPHIELQKTFQIGIQSQGDDDVLEAFPLVMHGQAGLQIEGGAEQTVRLNVGDTLTTTAWIAGQLPLMDEARILTDEAILDRLMLCSVVEGEHPADACQDHPLAPGETPGVYRGTRVFSEPGIVLLKVIAVDQDARSDIILQSGAYKVEVATPPPPESEDDEIPVAILPTGPLLREARRDAQVRDTIPNCTGGIVENVSGEGHWYRVRYQRSGVSISGWVPAENVLLVRIFEREHLRNLAVSRSRQNIYPRQGPSVYQVPECTLLEWTHRPEAGRWRVKIYTDDESEPDEGWIEPDQPGIETLRLP